MSGRTLDELAAKINVDAAGLRDSVARNNKYAETGVDVDFGKGELELNRFNGDAAHRPNPCLGPVATPPFYAVAVLPADIAVSTGLATDADARVLDTSGSRSPACTPAATTWPPSWAAAIPAPAPRSAPAWFLPIARSCMRAVRANSCARPVQLLLAMAAA